MTERVIDIQDKIQGYFDEVLDEANNRNTTHSNARGGTGENIHRANSSNSGKGKTATTVGSHSKSKLSKKQRKALGITKNNPQGNQPPKEEEPVKEEQPAPKEEEPKQEEPVQEGEPPVKEEPKQEEPKQEEPAQQEQPAPKEEEPKQEEHPAEQKEEPKEEPKNGESEEDIADADIDDETRQDAATEVVSKRINFFNKQLAHLYRAAGNLVAGQKEVFPIFDAEIVKAEEKPAETPEQNKPEDAEQGGEQPADNKDQNESFGNRLFAELIKEARLFEDEQNNQTPAKPDEKKEGDNKNDKKPFKLKLKLSKTRNKNGLLSPVYDLAKNLGIDSYDGPNIGLLCAVSAALISKYRALYKNIGEVNEYIKIANIELDGESINMNINNLILKTMFKVMKGTPGEKALRILNVFATKNIGSITSNTNFAKLIEALPNELSAETAKSLTMDEFEITVDPAKQPDVAGALGKVKKTWFNINKEEKEEEPKKEEPEKKPEEDKGEEKPESKPEENKEQPNNNEEDKSNGTEHTEENPK